MKRIFFINKVIRDILLSIVSPFVKGEHSILFIPHENCDKDNYDIFNYSSDNVLSLLNSVINEEEFNDYKLYIVYHKEEKKQQYLKYADTLKRRGPVVWIHKDESRSIIRAALRCEMCFTNHIHYDFQFKRTNQLFVSLGYFTPFKNDYYVIRNMSQFSKKVRCRKVNKSFDYYIVTSEISGRIISIDTLLDYSKFKVLGYPRNDIFYRDNSSLRNRIISKLGNPKHIICYTPTFRDYERPDLSLFNADKSKKKSILGTFTNEQEIKLYNLLEMTNAVIVAKLHPLQELSVLTGNHNDRIISFKEISNMGLSLYDLLAVSDSLLTDYTSTAFDFMHHNKPIIYYFYDYNDYVSTRGFSFNPIESFCGGKVAYSAEELIVSLKEILLDSEDEIEKRLLIHEMLNYHHDGSSTERIKDFIKKQSKC